jgi:HTH-type transcriptional regulator / antitoxin HipB
MQVIRTPRQIGAGLQSRRKHLGLSQAAVAAKIGLSQNRVSELESDPDTLTVAQLLALLNVLGLELTLGRREDGARTTDVEW